ncbi:MAG TPA: cytochrome-c oxidase, cbb3-type subunit II, partial [Flavobacteriaceae bacterium]|nr:cytochrome-c oxidase, cbb3-type subunit II [Flavobacteriaceae bacterium]
KASTRAQGEGVHSWIERTPLVMTIGAVLTLAVGGLVEIVPTIVVKSNVPTIASIKPYTPLELEGRDLYIREGCNACHTQMVRPFRDEVKRYGEYSKAGEFVYDHPFLWGSKRTGPDLHREGGKNPDAWHYKHMWNPRSTSDGSIMPRYPWLIDNKLDRELTRDKMKSMVALGVPYQQEDFDSMQVSMNKQALAIEQTIFKDASDLKELYAKKEAEAKQQGKEFVPLRDREITALIAYLQRLGTDIKAEQVETASN